MNANESNRRNDFDSDDESDDEYDVGEMNLHEIAHTDTPNKVKLEYILDEIQEDDDEDVATDGGVDKLQLDDNDNDDDGELICDGGQVPLKSFRSVRPETEIEVDVDDASEEEDKVDSCEECSAPLTGVERFTTRFVTVDGRHLCPSCADERSGKEKGFVEDEVER